MQDNQIIQLTFGDLKRLVSEIKMPTKRWLSTGEFRKRENLTANQLQYMIEKRPELFKKDGKRWKVDTKLYYKESA